MRTHDAAINVHVFVNDYHKILFENYFIKSLQDPWRVVPHILPELGREGGNFGTTEFKALIRHKIEGLVREILPRETDLFILSDVDIQFFAPCDETVRSAMREHDIVFQSEWGGARRVNTGFIAMRPGPGVLELWSEVYDALVESADSAEHLDEQMVMNTLLHASPREGLSWDVFPREIWAFSNQELMPQRPEFASVMLHHANCTVPRDGRSSLELKLEQMEMVKASVQSLRTRRP
ncbi:glycosyltransferase family 77 protein [Nocardia sp. NBC_01730]|uniref:putative nucleotide-diphospho-sugar transferase n=1 Tax=Nocardia sp. NBC_01730 TaxID=2975998 RepID=UPI002E14A152|nr:glycosyltransferase family 77 protein [Nocardia sp. NBC_01730]